MTTSLIGLGSNQGDRAGFLRRALEEISGHPAIRDVRCSRLYRTRPAGGPVEQQEFLNAVARLETSLDPHALLTALRTIEERLGRRREQRWGARTIDLDLLLYGELVFESHDLSLPHPRMAYRRFVLEPAVEIAADLVHPPTGWTLQRLLDHLNRAADYVAVTGPPGVPARGLVEGVAGRSGGVRLVLAPRPYVTPSTRAENSGGSPEQQLLESLQCRIGLLENLPLFEFWQGTPVVALSDFWLGEWPVLAEVFRWGGNRHVRDSLERMWQGEMLRVTPAKLLVILDRAGWESGATPSGADQATGSEVLDDLPRRLREQAERYHEGPVLRLDSRHLDEAIAEVSAAIEAMRVEI